MAEAGSGSDIGTDSHLQLWAAGPALPPRPVPQQLLVKTSCWRQERMTVAEVGSCSNRAAVESFPVRVCGLHGHGCLQVRACSEAFCNAIGP